MARKSGYSKESQKAKRVRAERILIALEAALPRATTELSHRSPYELLVATVLAAQATDKSVNAATPALFKRYPDAFHLAKSEPENIEPFIKTIGLYKAKAKNLSLLGKKLVDEYGGEVPSDLRELIKLPGVGMKTAKVVLGSAFGIPAIAVDTHLTRLASRLALSKETHPDKISHDLESLFPRDKWVFVHHALILHGRYRCTARNPKCEGCPLFVDCASRGAW